jgi:PIN domain nuclease of toxin-antitoxin system
MDTHVWLWWTAQPERLSAAARRAIDDADRIGVCMVSVWEVTMLVVRAQIALDRDIWVWVRQALALPRVEALELGPRAAIAAGLLEPTSFRAIRSIG